MPIKIKDIAIYVDLSPSTVSKALNDYPSIPAETKSRVVAAARELGYYPMAAARDLRRRKTNRIGFSFGFSNSAIGEFASRLMVGVVATAEQAGYTILLYPLTGDHLERLTSICKTGEVDGLLLMGGEHLAESTALLRKEQFPFVILNRPIAEPEVSFVTSDHYSAAVEATRHLIELGHQRIAYIGWSMLGQIHSDRIAGYRQALEDAHLPVDDSLALSIVNEPGAGAHAMRTLLARADPPTAVLAIHDPLAIECLQAVLDAGRRVPEDVAIVGADNLRSSQSTRPPLTTIDPPLAEIGRQAMEGLLRRLADAASPPTRLTLPVTLIVRESTSRPGALG
ncbi:MAG: LacI family DNA-binding transcriptional regulator [Anaerolineales bacterium]|nr:LacI family DNA-binding transcriptional regulator [Anaerolineales bacterium]